MTPTFQPSRQPNRSDTASAVAGLEQPVDFTGLAESILTRAVQASTGIADAKPRPGQLDLMNDIERALDRNPDAHPGTLGGQVLAAAPTGVGKTLSQLAPAAVAALKGQRTVISTESLALQAQIIDKDGPTVLDATQHLTGVRPVIAVHKGWSNFACSKGAVDTAAQLLGINRVDSGRPAGTILYELHRKLAGSKVTDPLVDWALRQGMVDETGTLPSGDKNTFPAELTSARWDTVSVAAGDCIGVDRCPFADVCRPAAARQRAAVADIVVTNHTMLGIQAAHSVPAIIGNRAVGAFNHIMVDEAHALPGVVRNQGAAEISGRVVGSLLNTLRRTLDAGSDTHLARLLSEGQRVTGALVEEVNAAGAGTGEGKATKIGPGNDPLPATGDLTLRWARDVAKVVEGIGGSQDPSSRAALKLRRLASRLEAFTGSLRSVRTGEPGTARWVAVNAAHTGTTTDAPARAAVSLQYAPVDVAGMLRANVWQAPRVASRDLSRMPNVEDRRAGEDSREGGGLSDTYQLNVVALSATIPAGFGPAAGIRAPLKHYESPFDTAYAGSALYIPRAVDETDIATLAGPASPDQGGRRRPRLDTTRHVAWAAAHICQLVEANAGSALILSATASAGRQYVEALRAEAGDRWKVLSQWDGQHLRGISATWKADVPSVLVGTKSLMTGVDAPGTTCTLVVVDRAPRAASNPVDDARVEALIDSAGYDRWSADRLVYVADAALLLAQASGRLIRGTADAGMVAVLDPRLLKVGPLTYPAQTRRLYLAALSRFTCRFSRPEHATRWLREQRATKTAEAA